MEQQETKQAEPKEAKKEKTAAERKEAREALVLLLLIVLIGVAILWFGFDLMVGVIGFVLWLIARFTGAGA